MDLIKELESQQMKAEKPVANVGDTVRVHVKIKEGSRERIQVFEGIVIAKKHGGIEETITVRRLAYGVGVEKVFPLHSPSIEKIEDMQMKLLPPLERYAPMAKSSWPPVPEMCLMPADSALT